MNKLAEITQINKIKNRCRFFFREETCIYKLAANSSSLNINDFVRIHYLFIDGVHISNLAHNQLIF